MFALPDFDEIVRRWIPPDELDEISQHKVSFRAALAAGDDPLHVITYLADLGIEVASLDDLAAAIEALEDEEELSIEWSSDGLVVRHASDGWLALFEA